MNDVWDSWSAARVPMSGIHLDSAAAGRSSRATLEAVTAHIYREAAEGAYVVAHDVEPVVEALRAHLGHLVGIDAPGVMFTESAHSALVVLLGVWPLVPGDTVAIAPSEWGPNVHAFTSHGLELVVLDVDGDGIIDVNALEVRLGGEAPPTVVHITPQSSHRALRQPASDIIDVCRRHGVPLWIDAAQTLGHCGVPEGASAVYATSRKWLAGPRGVGVLAVSEQWRPSLRVERPLMLPVDATTMSFLESREGHIAGRVGLAVAVDQTLAIGIDAMSGRLDEIGRQTRHRLGELPNWRVVGPLDAPGAITAIEPTEGQDVFEVRARLLAGHGVVTTACGLARAPLEMTHPTLRISPHLDMEPEHLDTLSRALRSR